MSAPSYRRIWLGINESARGERMVSTTVYFATNRVAQGPASDWRSYGADIVTPTDASRVTYAAAFVDGTELAAEGSGAITAISHAQAGGFDANVAHDILGSGKNILIFLHGFANSFENALTRAAFNRLWFAAAGIGAADTTVVAFSWPSLGQVIAAPPHLLPDDYLRDQSQAGRSGFHVASFFANLEPLLAQARGQGRRVFLLAHSMGSFALQAAVESWFSHGRAATRLFDEVFLAAGDERYDSFELPMGARLSRLGDLAARISIYYSIRDIALYLSAAVNLIPRLGHEGPVHRTDASRYPPTRYRIPDCAAVGDYDLFNPPDASHQYYRRSAKVRADIAAAMRNDPHLAGGPIRL
jgi:esterase/lipase superfamily enzyme